MRLFLCFSTLLLLQSCGIFKELDQYSSAAEAGWPYPLGVIENFDKFLILSEDIFADTLLLASINYCFTQNDYYQRKNMPLEEYHIEQDRIISDLISGLISLDSLKLDTSRIDVIEQRICPEMQGKGRWKNADKIDDATILLNTDSAYNSIVPVMHVFFWHTFTSGEQTTGGNISPGVQVPTGKNHHETSLLLAIFIFKEGELIYRNGIQAYRKELKPEDEAPNFEVSPEFFNQLTQRTMKAYLENVQ